jgi:hypothetical protein
MPPVLSFALKVDTVDVTTTWGLIISELRGNWDSPAISFAETVIPGRPGTTPMTLDPTLAALDFLSIGNIVQSTPSAFEDACDAIKYAFAKRTGIAIIGGNQPNRQRLGVLSSIKITPYPSMAQAKFEGEIHCQNPLFFATSTTTVAGSASTDLACAQGTFWSTPVITIGSPSSPFTITLKNSAGTTIGTMTFTGTGTSWVINCTARTVTVDGVRHDEYLTGTTGSYDFIRLDPRDGVLGTSSPSLRTSSGTISIVYTKTYL